jgi:hypothetical protein
MFSLRLAAMVTLIAVGWTNGWSSVASAQAPAAIEFDLLTEPGFRQENARAWFKVIDELDVRAVRIREGKAGDGVQIESVGEPPRLYRVTGALTRNNTLKVVGGSFALGDKAKLATWLAKVREGGQEALFEKPGPLGVTERQMTAARKQLSVRVSFSTKGEDAAALVERLLTELEQPPTLTAAARGSLAQSDKFPDELRGLTVGTSLAAALRPAGLALVMEKAGTDKVKFSIVDAKQAEAVWPVGWKPERPPKEYVPDLVKFLSVEIEDTPIADVIVAVQERLKTPVIVDQNSLARERVDLAETKVTIPKINTIYSRVLDKALFQAKLKMELRVDEADQPLLWITTIKQ